MGIDLERLEMAARIKAELRRRKQSTNYCPQEPLPLQKLFIDSEQLEVFYGGAVGGGKSSALLMAALKYVDRPNYDAIIFRRTFKDLNKPDSILTRAHEWLDGTDAVWSSEHMRFRFPKGATLTFAHFDNANTKRDHQGAAYQFVGWDELTQYPDGWYYFLKTRVRKKGDNPIPLRIRSTGNPGDIGHEWVYERFIRDGSPTREKCAFIPAKLDDNPHLNREEYLETLSDLPEALQRQMRDGIWMRDPSGLVYPIPAEDIVDSIPTPQYRLLAIDYGFTNACSFNVLAWRDNDPLCYVERSYKLRGLTPSDSAEEVRRLEAQYGTFVQMIGDAGGLGKGYIEESRQRYNLPLEAADKTNKRGYIQLFVGALERHQIKILRSGCEDLITEARGLPWESPAREREAPGFENHCTDGTLYGWRATQAHHNVPPPPPRTDMQRLRDEEREMMERAEERARNRFDPFADLL